jgi:hypothetical protein
MAGSRTILNGKQANPLSIEVYSWEYHLQIRDFPAMVDYRRVSTIPGCGSNCNTSEAG